MARLMLGLAAAAAVIMVLPAAAAADTSGGNGSGSGWNGHHDNDGHHDGRHDRNRGGVRSGKFNSDVARLRGRSPDGAWGYYEGDYDANRSFDADKWNDWWHERPNRAYPRWVQESQANPSGTCDTSRMWWSGAGWHC